MPAIFPFNAATVLVAAGLAVASTVAMAREPKAPVFDEASLRAHIERLASDEFEGRRPATAGEEKTVAYIESAYKAAGLVPFDGKSYRQAVPFIELATQPAPIIEFSGGDKPLALRYGDEAVYWTTRPVTDQALADSELVFVGYGIVEPQMGWNDYAGVDMRGKTAVVLVNDPGFATGDPALFKGRAMTYHGRWTYKFEEASRQGAAAVLIVHEDAPAAYPWDVVRNGAAKPQLIIDRPEDTSYRIGIEGWVTLDSAKRLFAAGGHDYAALKAQAAQHGFKPVPLGMRASTSVRNLKRSAVSSNVIGVLPGSERPDEYVLYTAHWDHLGKALAFAGDAVFNGAVDNATGTAVLLELASAFGGQKARPERSIAFVAFTAEEFGLLGSEYFAAHSPFPLHRIAGGVNIDAPAPKGRTREVSVTGIGASELEDYLREAATAQQRVLAGESMPEHGYYYRSDHFNLAKRGVPMLYFKDGVDMREGGKAAGEAWDRDYRTNRYHKPGDEYDASWDVSGLLEELQLYYMVGRRLANETRFPQWFPGNEFRPIREESLRAGASAQASQAP